MDKAIEQLKQELDAVSKDKEQYREAYYRFR